MERITGTYKSVTVVRSWAAATADGATSLVLETREFGTIAVLVPHGAVPLLRQALAGIEAFQAAGSGTA